MISKKIQDSLNEQMNVELFSSYAYLAMSAHFLSQHMEGFAHWMKLQAEEELGHAMKYYNYLNERGAEVQFKAIQAPNQKWDSVIKVFEESLGHEQKSTKLINGLMDLAISEKDHASQIFLQWFVTEQVEEEDSIHSILQKLKLIGNDPSGLLILDQKLGARAGDED
jgi:ferritin